MSPRFQRFPYLSAAILFLPVSMLAGTGLTLWGVSALFFALIWFAIEFVRWLMPPVGRKEQTDAPAPEPGGEADEPLTSLVFFLTEPRAADEIGIRSCVSNALGIRFQPQNPEAEYFVIPFSPPAKRRSVDGEIRHFMVKIPAGLFAVLVSDRPYIENPKRFARGAIRDKRLRQAVGKHAAWISVDLMDETGDREHSSEAYCVIGRIIAAMAGPDCLAIYCPELQRCNEFDPGLLEPLCGDDPLSLFDEPTFEPVIEISDNNPRMADAVREATTRWPEFVGAYRQAGPGEKERFIAKAEFREERKSEYMWVTVLEISPTEVTGVLINDPHELIDVHRGATVTFTLDRLNDWIYPGPGGLPIGGFTLDVLADSGEE
jgi:uncharacterized protein YegJ (DUF2314 family)